jgi:hypothetical protein
MCYAKRMDIKEAARMLGRKGGRANVDNHPKSHFQALSKKAAKARWGKSLSIKNKGKKKKLS